MKIKGLDGFSVADLKSEIQRGGRFVMYYYTVSIVVLTFKRPSDIYFVRGGETGVGKGLLFSFISFFFGWWGIPWGPIYTIQSLFYNLRGGKDVTEEVIQSLATAIDRHSPS